MQFLRPAPSGGPSAPGSRDLRAGRRAHLRGAAGCRAGSSASRGVWRWTVHGARARRGGRSRTPARPPSAWRGSRNCFHSLRQYLHSDDEILGLAEAGRGNSLVLLIGQRDAPAERPIDVLCHQLVSYGEEEFLGIGAGHGNHRQLALPGFAEPPLLRELLHETGPLALGVGPLQRGPGVEREDQDRREEDPGDDQLPPAGKLEIEIEFHELESTSYVSVR